MGVDMMRKKIKVLQLGKFFHPYKGGIELVSLSLAQALNNDQVECDVLCFAHDSEESDEKFEFKVIRARSILKFGSTCLSLDFFRSLKKIGDDYDIIHVHLPNPIAHLALLLCRPKAKIVLHWHSDIIRQKILSKFYRPFLKGLINRSSAIIGATKSHVNESDYSDLFLGKKFVIPYIFDHFTLTDRPVNKQAVAMLRRKFGDKKVLFSVGRHVYYKGFDSLISSAKFLSRDYVVLIGGTGPDTGDLISFIEVHGLKDRVHLLGRLTDEELINYLDYCSIFVLPSNVRSEMFGMVQLEAFARSKPVICTVIPRSGVSHVGKHGVTGLNVPVNAPKAIAEAAEFISSNPKYQEFCNGALGWIQSKYAHDKIVSDHISVYEQILDGGLST